MKIATWNIERLRHKSQLDSIIRNCDQVAADVLVLTETDSEVSLKYKYCIQTPQLIEIKPVYYKPTENRVSIYTNYKFIRQHQTCDKYTTLCVELETERGNLLVYGTIIGAYGNRHKSFVEDLTRQLADIEQLTAAHKRLCVCGDFNCSFSDNYYYTKVGRRAIEESFTKTKLALLTKNQPECIDHIALSESFISNSIIKIKEWNNDKMLSDHKGILVDIK
ncbi:MAG: endonuclease/exonuclease/phosphatase family protein [Oscillospiraceae bacterium]|nr:endonuclease/exonuclease/phosphatase family protein [Oscillospiraceae bacterium]